MKARLRSFLFSIQTKMVLAIAAVIVLAIFLSGVVFVFRTREERREQALDRVAAASPAIYQQAFFALLPRDEDERQFYEILNDLSEEQDVRILILSTDGTVLYETNEQLTGQRIVVPQSGSEDIKRGFVSWEPPAGFGEPNLTFVSASSRFVTGSGQELPFRIVLAVESGTIASAWLGVLPGLVLAALVAVPLASIAGILLARQVAQPVRRLTRASEAIAQGDFDQRIELDRDDEIGRLARSFTVMSQRVGGRDTQIRALLANVSHDLKTPMTSITGYAQSLVDGTAAANDAPRIGAVIRDEASHVNALLADLLYLGEIDAGQIITRRETVPLEELASRCVRRIEPVTRMKQIDLQVNVRPEVALHDVDPEKLERALTNVLENAAKFTPAGGEIAVRGWSENGSAPPQVLFSVTNSGSSIAEDDLPRVFDRFFRGDRTRRTATGSGLGLAITRELVELNHGHIDARNEPRGGVTFTMAFSG
ncbi:MAG: ATP-binding protein [Dehalococcoidia bacterium]